MNRSAPARDATIEVHEIDLDSREPQIHDLCRRVWRNRCASASRVPWIYRSNPAGKPRIVGAVSGRQNRLVGMLALFPWQLRARGESLPVAQIGDIMVDPDYQRQGIARRMLTCATDNIDDWNKALYYVYPNENSRPLLTNLGWQHVSGLVRRVRVLRQWKHIASRYVGKVPGRWIGTFLDRTQQMLPTARSARVKPAQVSPLDPDSTEFQEFARTVDGEFPFRFCRDAAFLKWRVLSAPSAGYRLVGLQHKQELWGYAAYGFEEHRAHIVDFLCFRRQEVLHGAIRGLVDYLASDRNVYAVGYKLPNDHHYRNAFRAHGFIARRHDVNPLFVWLPAGLANREKMLRGRNWHHTWADCDVE